jgi:hypothetical protein
VLLMFGISISGPAGAGKDYVARHLIEVEGFTKLSFAEPLKRVCAIITGVPTPDVDAIKDGRDGPDKAGRMRAVLQNVGVRARELWSESVWVDNLLGRVKALGPNARIVVTDCRFRNEFDALRAAGFRMVRVDAPTEFYRLHGEAALHPSERDLDGYLDRFDVNIFNDRTKSAADLAIPLMHGHPRQASISSFPTN